MPYNIKSVSHKFIKCSWGSTLVRLCVIDHTQNIIKMDDFHMLPTSTNICLCRIVHIAVNLQRGLLVVVHVACKVAHVSPYWWLEKIK